MPKKAKQLTPRQVAARRNGSLGGKARAKNLSSEALKVIAASGGKTTHQRYGDSFFGYISSRRYRVKKGSVVGRYRTPAMAEA